MGDQAVVLHEDGRRALAGLLFHAGQLIADGEGEPRAGIGVGHHAPAVGRVRQRLFHDLAALHAAGRQVGVDAVAVGHVGVQDGVEARLHTGTQRRQALDGPGDLLGLGGAGLLHVLEVGGVGAIVEGAQGLVVQHGVGLVHLDVLQAEAGGLDGHVAALQLDGGVAAAALHVVRADAHGLGNAAEVLQARTIFLKKTCHNLSLPSIHF